MKNLLIAIALLNSSSALAAGLVFEPYFNAGFSCHWLQGNNTKIALPAAGNDVQRAKALATQTLGQKLTVECWTAVYRCVHDGDVEPRVAYKSQTAKDLQVIGGAIKDAETGQTLTRINNVYFHTGLRQSPRCQY